MIFTFTQDTLLLGAGVALLLVPVFTGMAFAIAKFVNKKKATLEPEIAHEEQPEVIQETVLIVEKINTAGERELVTALRTEIQDADQVSVEPETLDPKPELADDEENLGKLKTELLTILGAETDAADQVSAEEPIATLGVEPDVADQGSQNYCEI